MAKDEIELGATYRDKVTGFKGVAVGYVRYMTGCNQALLVPPVDDKGATVESHWYDVQRLERQKTAVIELDNTETPGCDKPAPNTG